MCVPWPAVTFNDCGEWRLAARFFFLSGGSFSCAPYYWAGEMRDWLCFLTAIVGIVL